ncbi:MAG: SDR family NAD(P)-dependent oxidoreductase [Cyclobacteriaceae bacterium]
MSQESFNEEVAIVTGAGSGIGFEIARQLSNQGAAVLLNDIDPNLAEEASNKLVQAGSRCLALPGDASDLTFIQKMVSEAVSHFGKLTIAVANAGLTSFGTFLDYSPEKFQQVVDLNLRGSFFLAQAAAKQMKRQQALGRILFMSSVTGHQAHDQMAAYGMSKAALQMLAKALVVELGPYGITVNCISPGAVVTERTVRDDPEYEKAWSKVIPNKITTLPNDIARAALFLLSKDAGQINGQTIIVDGGWTSLSPMPDVKIPDE